MNTSSMLRRLICVLSMYMFCNIDFSLQVSCKDENDKDIDWFILYKLPKIKNEESGSNLNDGKAYAYLTSDSAAEWTLSSISVESPDSMLGKTWKNFDYKKKEDSTYLFYNDHVPDAFSGITSGHLKGIVAFNMESGFWLIHSIPKFGDHAKYNYPKNALIFGQTALCVTYKTEENLNQICNHLIFSHPNIYKRYISENMNKFLDETAKSLFSKKPDFITTAPFLRDSTLKSLGKEEFHSFAKDNQCLIDIYSEIIAPHYKTAMVSETWRKGAGINLKAFCEKDQTVNDAESIKMTVSNRKEPISFQSTLDHSKWAVSANTSSSPLFCISDLNRMASQAKRGGGAVCLISKPVWEAFNSIIDKTNKCPA